MKRLIGTLGMVLILLLSIAVPFFNQQAKASSYPQIIKMSPDSRDQFVPVDTDIQIQFNSPVRSINSQNIKLQVKTNSGYFYDVPIKSLRKDGETLRIIPDGNFQFNKEYRVEFNGPAAELQNGTFNTYLSYSFQTNYIDFYELMVVNERRLTNILNSYAPRQIKVFPPERYINELTVMHKKPGALADDQTAFSGVTNIDIVTKDFDVKYVHVDLMKNGKILQKGFASKVTEQTKNTKKNSFIFDIGFTKVPDFFDVRVTVQNANQETIDTKVIKFAAEEGKDLNSFKETYKYVTAGNVYSLHDLLSDEKLFTSLLAESQMEDIKVQVVDR